MEVCVRMYYTLSFLSTAKRYIPLVADGGIMEIVQQMTDPSCEGVSKRAQKLINAVKDFHMTGN